MKRVSLFLLALTGSLSLHAASSGLVNGHPPDLNTLKIGDTAPDFELIGIHDKIHKLDEYKGGKVLVVLFTSNHCPTSHGMEPRLRRFYDEYSKKGVKLVAINPNHPDGLSKDELGYGEFNDSFEEMKLYAAKNQWPFDYLYDGEKQTTARAYGCLATPHAFVFDENLKLRYAGRFDDSRFADESTVKSRDLQNAVDAILAGKPVPVEITRPHGCSTKWREKKAMAEAKHESWAKTPVTIETIDAAGIAQLRANPTRKYRLFNVWATWCAPCVEEFPALVEMSRRFDMRDFELITISLDQPSDKAKAEEFLFKQAAGMSRNVANSVRREGRTTNHYLFTGSADELAAALDKEMPGPIPHTVFVAPGGEIVFRHNGVIDPAETLKAILDRMNRFYSDAPGAPR
ncbi:MAG TPA: redoxin domain-containing protein [Verrucomicrobia bacterium]|nr:redoxin domain-containing protein [Verrucomicrobiota bacterium]HOP96445.1 redoxin domain-containing protein [Verrucomicrobiota bacterium]HPU56108.1 redoxin domain-containing protein [Verrucomicrobiota bacterium]